MRHKLSDRHLNRDTNGRLRLLRSLAANLIICGKVETTSARAKELRRVIDKLINRSKMNDLNSRKSLMAFLGREALVLRLINVITPGFGQQKNGFTRIVNLGTRNGDGAEIVQIELLKQK